MSIGVKKKKEEDIMYYSIAIDGPAGAGKSTIAKIIAKNLGFIYVDTGAMYRAMALYLLRNKIVPTEEEEVASACNQVDVSIVYENQEQQVILNGENVSAHIRTEEVGKIASISSKNKAVRLKLVDLQRSLAQKANVVMDGRDIGTYVLPEASVKIFLTADSGVRAQRRWLELKDKGEQWDVGEIQKEIIARDQQDMNREFAPLRQAEDARLIDTSHMDIQQVADKIIEIFRENQ